MTRKLPHLFVVLFFAALALMQVAAAFAQSSSDAVADTPQTSLMLWSAVVGFVLPPVLSVVIQTGWSQQLQGLVSFLACLIASGGTVWFQGDFGDGTDMATAFLLVFTTAIGTYRLYWKPSGIAPAIERSTNVSGSG